MRLNNPVLLNSVANSGTKLSQVIDGSQIFSGSIQASFTDGSAAGTLTLLGSNDNSPPSDANGYPAPTNWSTVANGSINATATIASGALTSISMQWLNWRWYQVKWVQSGGAGTITVTGNLQNN